MISVRQVVAEMYATNCWIVHSNSEAVIIDPGIGNPHLLKAIDHALEDLRPLAVIATHGHLDHTFSITPLTKSREIPAYIHSKDRELLTHPERALSRETRELFAGLSFFEPSDVFEIGNGDCIAFGNIELCFDHRPGHTAGSMVIRSESDKLLFSGDVLFKDGIGRTDLPTGSASQMQESLRELFLLSDDYQVLPGHGDRTTIAEERKHNQYVSLALEGRL